MKRFLVIAFVFLAVVVGFNIRKTNGKPSPAIQLLFVPRSFIPGGVHTVEQFRAALAADKSLAAEFPGFDFSKAHFEWLGHPVCAYVAYRDGKDFRWTKRCKLLPADTLVLTDGTTYIRAKCGNKLAFSPQVPVIDSDVTEAIDTPGTDGDVPPVSGTPVPTPTPVSQPVQPVPPVISMPVPEPPCVDCGGIIVVPPPRRISADDGDSGCLWIAVAALFGALVLVRARG